MVDTHRIYEWMTHPEQLDRNSLHDLRALLLRYPYFQSARLLYLRALRALDDPLLTEELHRAAAYITDSRQLFRLMDEEKSAAEVASLHEERPASADRTLELIDAFLLEGEAPRTETEEPADDHPAAEEGEKEDEGLFFTETLAKIYIKQQRYSKALEIIKKLYLKNPKKNVYFADQIRFLEKLIINNKQK